MLSITHNFTSAEKIKRPSYSTVATWIKESWDEVDNNLIQRSFKCYGILTKTDSSEDYYIFDYDKLSDPVNDEDDEIIEVVDDEEEYVEEDDYENEWNVKNNNNNKDKDEDEDQKLSSTDNEEEMNELRKKYKSK